MLHACSFVQWPERLIPGTDLWSAVVIRPIVTRKDLGGHAFNWLGLLGSTTASSLSNAYYPVEDRGVGPAFRRVGPGIPFSACD